MSGVCYSPGTSNDILHIQVYILQYIFSRMVLAYHPTHPVEILSAFSLPNFELFHSTEALPLTHPLLTTPK